MTQFGPTVRDIRERLRRDDRRYSVRQVAQRVGIEPAYLSKIERSEVAPPSEATTVRLAAELGQDPDGALTLGVLFFRKLLDLAAERFPEKTLRGRLDCADKPGLALAAFRHGLDASIETDDDRFRRLQDIARACAVRAVRKRGREGA